MCPTCDAADGHAGPRRMPPLGAAGAEPRPSQPMVWRVRRHASPQASVPGTPPRGEQPPCFRLVSLPASQNKHTTICPCYNALRGRRNSRNNGPSNGCNETLNSEIGYTGQQGGPALVGGGGGGSNALRPPPPPLGDITMPMTTTRCAQTTSAQQNSCAGTLASRVQTGRQSCSYENFRRNPRLGVVSIHHPLCGEPPCTRAAGAAPTPAGHGGWVARSKPQAMLPLRECASSSTRQPHEWPLPMLAHGQSARS